MSDVIRKKGSTTKKEAETSAPGQAKYDNVDMYKIRVEVLLSHTSYLEKTHLRADEKICKRRQDVAVLYATTKLLVLSHVLKEAAATTELATSASISAPSPTVTETTAPASKYRCCKEVLGPGAGRIALDF